MADRIITITSNCAEVQKRLGELARRSGSMQPALKAMGMYLELSTRKRFDTETDPSGQKWKPIKAATIARKARKGKPTAILHEDLNLRDRITSAVQGETLLVGSPEKYAAAQQLGADFPAKRTGTGKRKPRKGPGRIKIASREFLGVSTADEAELLLIAGDYLTM